MTKRKQRLRASVEVERDGHDYAAFVTFPGSRKHKGRHLAAVRGNREAVEAAARDFADEVARTGRVPKVEAPKRRTNPQPANVPIAGRRIMEAAYQSALDEGATKQRASRISWGALKRAGYRKDPSTGKWRKHKPNPKRGKPTRAAILESEGISLGTVVELVYERADRKHVFLQWRQPSPVVWWAVDARALCLVDGGPAFKRSRGEPQVRPSVVRLYEDFHGRPESGSLSGALPSGALRQLGVRAVSITYRSNKRHGGGTGRVEHFEHEFSRSDTLWGQSKSGPRLLCVVGPRLTVTERGIVY